MSIRYRWMMDADICCLLEQEPLSEMYVRARIGAYGTTAVFSKEKAGGVQEEVSRSAACMWITNAD